jgi:hypothetical protein
VATTVDQQRINNLPINERNYLSFALTTSTVGRDRPTHWPSATRLNFVVNVAGPTSYRLTALTTDNSVNAARSTVSQEAVQEFQVVTNSLYRVGRSAGGVVNVVTKSGTNDFHGNIFGFLRHRASTATLSRQWMIRPSHAPNMERRWVVHWTRVAPSSSSLSNSAAEMNQVSLRLTSRPD